LGDKSWSHVKVRESILKVQESLLEDQEPPDRPSASLSKKESRKARHVAGLPGHLSARSWRELQLSEPQAVRQRLRLSSQETKQGFLLQICWHWMYWLWQSFSHCEAAELLLAVRAVTAKPSAKLSIIIFFLMSFSSQK